MKKMALKRRCRLFLALGFLFLEGSSFLTAQYYESFQTHLNRIKEQTRWKIGPFRLFPAFQLRDIGYDNNVYYQRETEPRTGDYTVTISPTLTAYLLYRNRIILSIAENPEYVFFFKEKQERAFNNGFFPEIKVLLFNRFVLSGNYRYQKTRRRASSEFDVRADERTRGYGGGLFYETPRQTAVGVSVRILKLGYEEILQSDQEQYLSVALNRTEKDGNFEFYYRAFSESFLFINAGYTDYQFEFKESQWRDSSSFQFYTGLRFPLLGRIRGTLALGYKRFTPDVGGKKPFSGLIGNTRLDGRLGRFGLRLSYERDCRFSYYLDYIYYLENLLGAGISYYLTRFLRLDYDLAYGKNDYPERTRLQLPDGGWTDIFRKDTYYYHTAGVVVRVFQRTGVGVMYNAWKRNSNIVSEKRRRWFLGGYITFDF